MQVLKLGNYTTWKLPLQPSVDCVCIIVKWYSVRCQLTEYTDFLEIRSGTAGWTKNDDKMTESNYVSCYCNSDPVDWGVSNFEVLIRKVVVTCILQLSCGTAQWKNCMLCECVEHNTKFKTLYQVTMATA